MGEKDITEKTLEDYNDVFADIINVFLFGGERLVREDDLINTRNRSQLKIAGEIHEQERDNAKIWKNGLLRIAFIGIENQTVIDNTEPARVLSYDGASYKEQLLEIDRCRRNKTDIPKLIPVITLVVYYGKGKWTKKSLFECVEVPEFLKAYVNDYKINVINMSDLKPEIVNKFRSDFKFIAEYYECLYNNKEYKPSNGKMQHQDEVLKLMAVLTGDNRFEKSRQRLIEEGKENATMCEALDIIEARGEARGEIRERRKAIRNMIDLGVEKEKILMKYSEKDYEDAVDGENDAG